MAGTDCLNNCTRILAAVHCSPQNDNLVLRCFAWHSTSFTKCVQDIVFVGRQFNRKRLGVQTFVQVNLVSIQTAIAVVDRTTVFTDHEHIVGAALHQRYDDFFVAFQQDLFILCIGPNNLCLCFTDS